MFPVGRSRWARRGRSCCGGGGDRNPTGPGAGGGIAGAYDLVALGRAGLPVDIQPEDCTVTRFYSGGLRLNGDGTWEMALQFHKNEYGDAEYADSGQFEEDGTTVWLDSEASGSRYEATVDGKEMKIMYDWCYDGTPGVQLVFDR
jgi:hypothetical protein